MRFKRVTFGIKSSPFLLNATIQYHLKNMASTRVVQELLENLNVDDLLCGANSTKEINNMYCEADSIMLEAGMKLAKWNSNNVAIKEYVADGSGDNIKVLGAL